MTWRAVLLALEYRCIATIATWLVAYWATGQWGLALLVASADVVLKVGLHALWLHVRVLPEPPPSEPRTWGDVMRELRE